MLPQVALCILFGLTHVFSCWINLNMQNSVSAVSQFTLFVSSAVTDNFKIDLKPLSVHENRNDYFSRYCCEDGMLHSYLNVLLTFILCLKIESRPDMSSFICVIVCSAVMWVYWNYILTFFHESSWASIFVFWIAVHICQNEKCILHQKKRMYSMQDKKPTGQGLFFYPAHAEI